MKLYLIRGLPGSGKSTLARELATALGVAHFEHDAYLYTPEGEYLWTETRMAYAYRACIRDTRKELEAGRSVVVSNVFPTGKSLKRYQKMAEDSGAEETVIIVENRRGGTNIHNVPEEALAGMRAAFQVEL